MEHILQQLTVSQKRSIIKANDVLNELFKQTNKNLSKAKLEEIDTFIGELNEEEKKIILEMSATELGVDEKSKMKKKTKKDESQEESQTGENIPAENLNQLTDLNNEMVTTETEDTEVPAALTESAESEKVEREIPEEIRKNDSNYDHNTNYFQCIYFIVSNYLIHVIVKLAKKIQ